MTGASYTELESVLDQYDSDEIRITKSHDGFSIYKDEGDTYIGDELLWRWDPAHDREPFNAIEVLFERLGYSVEQL